ncbi:MAG: PIN domain-containing protein [Chloroflexi bacterium]|nr:PIN domain-containing protein [Chloroflexota bacterium]
MAAVLLIDTHVLVWLYAGLLERIPLAVQARLNREQLAASPVVLLELGYLNEVGRLTVAPPDLMRDLSVRLELVTADISAAALFTRAFDLSWTGDPFDRLLAAHALATGWPLVTKDESLRQHLPLAWWAD